MLLEHFWMLSMYRMAMLAPSPNVFPSGAQNLIPAGRTSPTKTIASMAAAQAACSSVTRSHAQQMHVSPEEVPCR
ncbi:hypothetical protein [Bradyrhizobium sp. 199]|uniref:hypothetical protein n=1 Tax=Bradyrhizobium sp. 199 TaxID=2782664 RepID=UPI001FF9C3F2|nr:hypothetical protein [Bradyrhizobium sp. 199]MCK1360418.1 hypothetical protein [Bradyrhizobium sp. 199]